MLLLKGMYPNYNPIPCFHCHPHTYIRMVQHLIEVCLLLHMNRDQCIKALAKHARVRPPITLAVWRELLKENRPFFEAYFQDTYSRSLIRSRKNFHKESRFSRRRTWR